MAVKQKKVSIPENELKLAKEQAKKDGFGENVTGWIRWVIRGKCKSGSKNALEVQT